MNLPVYMELAELGLVEPLDAKHRHPAYSDRGHAIAHAIRDGRLTSVLLAAEDTTHELAEQLEA